MKIVCSINGIDGVGKTTQVKMIEKEKYNFIRTVYGLENYEGFPKLDGQDLHKWWFETSTIDEFCDAFYESLTNRNNDIMNSEESIVILDKGIINFEARIRATLKVRGFSQDDIEASIKKSKIKNKFQDIENCKIIILNNTLSKEKIDKRKYEDSQIEIYKKYQYEQIKEVNSKKNEFDYFVNYNLGIEKANFLIKGYILLELARKLKINISQNVVYEKKDNNYIDFNMCCYNTEQFKKVCERIIKNDFSKKIQLYNVSENEKYKGMLIEKANKLPKITKKITLKSVEKYEIPEFYKTILCEFINEIKMKMKNLNLILIHGSAGRECMHENWSDLDIIICLERYTFDQIKEISKIIDKYKEKVKIGSTIYSKLELESLNVDAKTLYALYQMQREEILPIVCEKVEIPIITHEDLVNKNLNVLPEAIHKLKRLLYNENNLDKQTIIKTLNLIMKVILISNNIFCKSYEEVFFNFSRLYNLECIDIKQYLNKNEIENNCLVDYAKKIIEIVINE